MPELQARIALERQTIDSTLFALETDSAPSDRSDDIGRSETMFGVFDSALLVTELFKRGTERYVKESFKISHCDYLQMREIQKQLKILTLCNESR